MEKKEEEKKDGKAGERRTNKRKEKEGKEVKKEEWDANPAKSIAHVLLRFGAVHDMRAQISIVVACDEEQGRGETGKERQRKKDR